ncbi:unnamed protein product [Cuscuta epithymum]|uniref:Uncharacterized protein n=1 Tax=Cuscuta epithymum TaxID=186058 RepID=A0AAV0DQQ6_9ASTE|nr:unnamed protein product [Cuscuta epithymum]
MRLVDWGNDRRITIIIPEGWKGDGFRTFSSVLLEQQDRYTKLLKREMKKVVEDSGTLCSDLVDSFSQESKYISSLLFDRDLYGLGAILNSVMYSRDFASQDIIQEGITMAIEEKNEEIDVSAGNILGIDSGLPVGLNETNE